MKFDQTFIINKLTLRFQGETKYDTDNLDTQINGIHGAVKVSYYVDRGQFDDSLQPVTNYATLANVHAKLQNEIARCMDAVLPVDAKQADKVFKRIYTDYYAHNGANLWLALGRRYS